MSSLLFPLHSREDRRKCERAGKSKPGRLWDSTQQNCHYLQGGLCPSHYKDLQFHQVLQQRTWGRRQPKVAASLQKMSVNLSRANGRVYEDNISNGCFIFVHTCGHCMFMMHYELFGWGLYVQLYVCLCLDASGWPQTPLVLYCEQYKAIFPSALIQTIVQHQQ